MGVALFITCFNDTLFPQTGRAVVTLLERLGCEVDFPEAQTCCGQMHTNTGYQERGLALARRFERVFADAEVVVSPSASCVAYLRENGAGLDGRLVELTEFLGRSVGGGGCWRDVSASGRAAPDVSLGEAAADRGPAAAVA